MKFKNLSKNHLKSRKPQRFLAEILEPTQMRKLGHCSVFTAEILGPTRCKHSW